MWIRVKEGGGEVVARQIREDLEYRQVFAAPEKSCRFYKVWGGRNTMEKIHCHDDFGFCDRCFCLPCYGKCKEYEQE